MTASPVSPWQDGNIRLGGVTLLDSLPLPAWVSGSDGRRDRFNAAWSDLTGAPSPTADTWLELVHDEDLSTAMEALARAAANKAPFACEYRLKTRSREYRYVRETANPIFGERGEFAGFLGILADCQGEYDERDRAVHEHAMLESCGDALIATDLEGRIIAWNQASTEMYGYTAEEALGRLLTETVISPDVGDQLQAALARVSAGESWSNEFPVRKKDGTQFMVGSIVTPVRNGRGEVVALLGVNRDLTEMRALREAEQSQRRLLEATLQQLPSGVLIADADRKLLVGNSRAEQIWRTDLSDPAGRERNLTFESYGADGERIGWDDWPINRSIRSGAVVSNEQLRIVTGDGSERLIEASSAPVYGADGSILAAVAVFDDVTVEAEQQRELEASLARHAALTDSVAAIVIEVPTDGRPPYFNRRWFEYTGLSEEESRERGWRSAVHPEDAAHLPPPVDGTGDGRWEAEFRLRRHDGVYRWHFGRVAPLFDSAGNVTAVTGTAVDIQALKDGQDAAARLAAIVQSSSDAIISLDVAGRITSWNQGAEALYGYTADEMLGRNIAGIMPPHRASDPEHVHDRVRGGERISNYETQRVHKDGSLVDVSLSVSPVRDGQGNVIGAATIARDITAEKRISQEVAALNQALRERVEEFETLLNVLPIGIGIATDPACDDVRTNPAFAGMLGIDTSANASYNESGGRQPFRVLDAEGNALAADELPLQRAAATGETIMNFEARVVREGEPPLRLLEFAAPLLGEGGQPRGAVGAFIDVTALKDAEDRIAALNTELQDRVNMLETLLEVLPIGIAVTTDPEMRDVRINPALASWLGWSNEQNTSVSAEVGEDLGIFAMKDGVVVEQDDMPLQAALLHGRVSTDEEYTIVYPDGSERVLLEFGRPLFDDDGNIRGAVAAGLDITARKRIEEELARSEARYRDLANALPAIVFTADDHANIEYVNDYGVSYTGAAPDDVLGRRWTALIHPDDLEPALATARERASGGEPFEIEQRLRRHDGEYRWQLLRQVPLKDASGKVLKWFGTAMDIHDRKVGEQLMQEIRVQLEDALAAQGEVSALLETLFRNAPLGFAFLDTEMRFLRVNEELARLNNMPASDHIGRIISEVLPAVPGGVIDDMRRVIQTGEPIVDVRSTTVSTDDPPVTRHWLNSYYPVRSASGETVGIGIFVRDVTQHVAAEEAIAAENALRKVITDNATAALFMMDAQGRCTFMNPAAEAMFGLSAKDVEGRTLHDVIHYLRPDGSPYPMSECPIDRALPTNSDLRAHEDLFLRGDGSFFPVSCAASPIIHEGRPIATVVEVRDVTEERAADDRLAAAQARLQLLADAGSAVVGTESYEGSLERLARVAVPSFADICLIDLVVGDHIERAVVVEETDSSGIVAALQAAVPNAGNASDPVTRVIATGQPYFVERFDEQALDRLARNPEHRAAIQEFGMVSGISVPLKAPGGTFGAVSLGVSRRRAPYTHADVEAVMEFGRRMGAWVDSVQLIQNLRASNESLNRAQGRLQLLADSGQQLGRSEDFHESLENSARLAVPAFADLCIVDLVDHGEVERAVVVAADHLPEEVVEAFRATPPALADTEDIIARVARTGEPAFYPRLNDAVRRTFARNEEHLQAIERFSAVSAIIIPLTSGDTTYGVIGFTLGEGDRHYSIADFEVAYELGRRIAAWLEKVRLIDDLRKANEAKDEFMGMISHEMRTPMTVINGGARLLARRGMVISDDERSQLVADMQRESDRLLGMVDNLLTLARVELAEEPENEPVILSRVIQRVIDGQRDRGSTREVQATIAPGMPLVAAHSANLEQVIRNLVVNAEKYSPPSAPVEIDCRIDGAGGAEVRVLDRGSGVDPGELELIFQRFYRSERTAKTVGGSGLGLALCKRLVEAMGGEIWARPREGGGLEVGFRLPVYNDAL